MELSCENVDEVDSWKASFLRAGVYPEKAISSSSGEEVRNSIGSPLRERGKCVSILIRQGEPVKSVTKGN